MILFLTPTATEQKHITTEPWVSRKIIGIGDNCLRYERLINQDHYKLVILFGCCGLLSRDMPFLGALRVLGRVNYHMVDEEYQKYSLEATEADGITTNKPIHEKEHRELLFSMKHDIVDQESYHVLKMCERPLIIIRYGIDYCDKKLVPFPFNHHTRMLQHYICQKKMNGILNRIWYGGI